MNVFFEPLIPPIPYSTMYPSQLSHSITQAIERLQTEMEQAAPVMAAQVIPWQVKLAGKLQPEAYFMHPLAFPALLLPWWTETALGEPSDPTLQAELAYSTINGYYHIRLIDNLMDGHATVERELLPALNFFHTQFQSAYHPYFPADHPFWAFFNATWFRSGEAAMEDAALMDIDEATFKRVAAQKVCAAKIPVAAVCYRHNRADAIAPWADFIDHLGGWHQFRNDLFDWHKDMAQQTTTYFLCEAERRRRADESLISWVAREGFAWGIDTAQAWLANLKTTAQTLNSPDLLDYLTTRESMLLTERDKIASGLQSLAKLAKLK
ncbi:MAG: hypothetical protein KDJ52_22165 [Anaerolineae bacterium]|nr:hypothetical protein [Anaerolineae bacterium]